MIAVDTNVLVYAHRREPREHTAAAQVIAELATGTRPWSIPWPCVYEFFSVATNVRIWKDAASTPTQAWAQLEAWFGRPLFDRSGRSVRPTELAHEAARVGRELGERLSSLRARARTGVGGEVRLGAIATVQADALPRALRSLRDRHRALEVRVTLGDSSELLDALKAGRIEAAVLVPNLKGAQRAFDAGVPKVNYVLSASEAHNMSNVRRTTDESIEDFRRITAFVVRKRPDVAAAAPVLHLPQFRHQVVNAFHEPRISRGRVHETGRRQIMTRDVAGKLFPFDRIPATVPLRFRFEPPSHAIPRQHAVR